MGGGKPPVGRDGGKGGGGQEPSVLLHTRANIQLLALLSADDSRRCTVDLGNFVPRFTFLCEVIVAW